jgi:protein-L-isoaspartate O-methyltransferase
MTTQSGEKSRVRREELVKALSARGVIRSHAVRDAFAAIPREVFVPSFYQEEDHGWARCSPADLSEDEWLTAIYRDEPLVTKVSGRNLPISSSSMPSVMARMLETLQVERGHRVLEIGTGTGYNAALLALLAGSPACVTTVEVDAQMAAQARGALHRTVGEVQVQVGDGLLGAVGETGLALIG